MAGKFRSFQEKSCRNWSNFDAFLVATRQLASAQAAAWHGRLPDWHCNCEEIFSCLGIQKFGTTVTAGFLIFNQEKDNEMIIFTLEQIRVSLNITRWATGQKALDGQNLPGTCHWLSWSPLILRTTPTSGTRAHRPLQWGVWFFNWAAAGKSQLPPK